MVLEGRVWLHLGGDQFLEAVTELHHALHTGPGLCIQFGSHHDAVLAEIDLAIDQRVGEALHVGVGRDSAGGFIVRLRGNGLAVRASDTGHGVMELLRQVRAGRGIDGVIMAVAGAFDAGAAQDHFGVVVKIAVDRVAVRVLHGADPVRQGRVGLVQLLQE